MISFAGECHIAQCVGSVALAVLRRQEPSYKN
jgi:hypothetical protein